MYESAAAVQAAGTQKAHKQLRKCESQSDFDGPPLPPRQGITTLPRRQVRSHSFDTNDFLKPQRPGRVFQLASGFQSRQATRAREFTRKKLSLQEESYSTRLLDFISRSSHTLPTRIQVTNGFCSSSTDLLISQNERFNLHFVKHTKVIVMHDSKHTEQYSVPLNSSIQFGLVYDPHHNSKEAQKGYHFETAASIMSMNPLPRLVRATKECKGAAPGMSVDANEVLIVKGIMKKRGKFLIVQSLKHGEKHLHEKCAGHFSTAPKDVRMHITTMMKFGISFPQRAIIFPDGDIDRSLSLDMTKFPVTLGKFVKETSVIASSIFETDYEVTPVMEVLLNLDIRVEPVQLSEDERRHLNDHTRTLHSNFNSSNVQLFAELPSSRAYDLQSLLYKQLLAGHERESTELELPLVLRPEQPLPYETPTHRSSSIGIPAHGESQQLSSSPSSPIIPPSPPTPSTPEGSTTDVTDSMYHTIDSSKRHSQVSVASAPVSPLQQQNSPILSPLESRATDVSENVYQSIDSSKHLSEVPTPDSSYTTMNPAVAYAQPRRMTESRINTLEYNHRNLEYRCDQMCQKVDELMVKVEQLSQAVTSSANAQGSSDGASLKDVTAWCGKMQEEIEDLKAKVATASTQHRQRGFPEKPHMNSTPEQNQQLLATFDCDQVGPV